MVKGSLVWAVAGAGGAPATGRVSCGRRGSREAPPRRPLPPPLRDPPADKRIPPADAVRMAGGEGHRPKVLLLRPQRIPAGLRFPPERRRGHDVTRRQPEEEVGQSGRLAGALVHGEGVAARWARAALRPAVALPQPAVAGRDGELLD